MLPASTPPKIHHPSFSHSSLLPAALTRVDHALAILLERLGPFLREFTSTSELDDMDLAGTVTRCGVSCALACKRNGLLAVLVRKANHPSFKEVQSRSQAGGGHVKSPTTCPILLQAYGVHAVPPSTLALIVCPSFVKPNPSCIITTIPLPLCFLPFVRLRAAAYT